MENNGTMKPADPFRRQYRELTPEEQFRVATIKDGASSLLGVIEAAVKEGAEPRCIALAKTKLEEAVFWATKGVTG